MDFADVGNKIRAAREKNGLTQAEVARSLGMSRATISKLENATIQELGIRKIAKVCDRLGLDIVVVQRRPPTLHEAYESNRAERREAFQQIGSDVLVKQRGAKHG
jgi:transcriptional regulator with XRE-family HTH domain